LADWTRTRPIRRDGEEHLGLRAAVIADYDAEMAVERELVWRIATLLWRLRRIITFETDLFAIQAEIPRDRRNTVTVHSERPHRAISILRSAKSCPTSKPKSSDAPTVPKGSRRYPSVGSSNVRMMDPIQRPSQCHHVK
jgi:hypothetical protein